MTAKNAELEVAASSFGYEALHEPAFLERLADEQEGSILALAVYGVVREMVQDGPTEDFLHISRLGECLDKEAKRNILDGPAHSLYDNIALMHQMSASGELGESVDTTEEFIEDYANDLLNLLIANESASVSDSYTKTKDSITQNMIEKERLMQKKITLTKEQVQWLNLESGSELELDLILSKTPNGRSFFWANIINHATVTKKLFESIDPGVRQWVVTKFLEKVTNSVEMGKKSTMPASSTAGFSYEGRYKKTVFPVWKARNIDGSEYRGFALRSEDVELEDGTNAPVFLLAIACNHNKQNGNHSPVYSGILGGTA